MMEQANRNGPTNLEIPDGPEELKLRAKLGRDFNMALLAAAQHDCDCYACKLLQEISKVTVDQAVRDLDKPPAPTPEAPATPAAAEAPPAGA